MSAVRKQAYLTPAQDQALKRLARARGVSEAEILRLAIDAYLWGEGQEGRADPYAAMIGLGASGAGTGSVDHDDICNGR